MLGEVVVVLNRRGPGIDYVREPSMQLASKMRFDLGPVRRPVPLGTDLWLRSPTYANAMACGVLLAGAPRVIVPASPAAQHLGRGDG